MQVYIIVNSSSGTGKASQVWRQVKKILEEHEIAYKACRTRYKGHAEKLAQEISSMRKKAVYLLIVGGDGTINEVLNGITDFGKVRIGIIPAGSGNDFAGGLGLSKDPSEALGHILACIQKEQAGNPVPRLDLGQVSWPGCSSPRFFGISAGVGLDALVCKKAMYSPVKKALNKIRLGKLTYILLTVESLFSMETAELIMEYGGGQPQGAALYRDKTIFAAVMNLRTEGGGVPMAPKASPKDGKLSVCCAYGIPKWRTFFCLPFLMAARHENIKGFGVMDLGKIHMETDRPIPLHADGEYLGDVTEAEFVCLKGRMQLLSDMEIQLSQQALRP